MPLVLRYQRAALCLLVRPANSTQCLPHCQESNAGESNAGWELLNVSCCGIVAVDSGASRLTLRPNGGLASCTCAHGVDICWPLRMAQCGSQRVVTTSILCAGPSVCYLGHVSSAQCPAAA